MIYKKLKLLNSISNIIIFFFLFVNYAYCIDVIGKIKGEKNLGGEEFVDLYHATVEIYEDKKDKLISSNESKENGSYIVKGVQKDIKVRIKYSMDGY